MKNLFISNLHQKDVEHCTSNLGLFIRRKLDKPFKKLCNIFTKANIIKENKGKDITDEEYFNSLSLDYIPLENYNIKLKKNNIVLERYPKLNDNEPYIFVCNHTCPEDIETVLNVLDRNAYLILGSIESLQYNPEIYLSFLNGMIPFDIMDKRQRKLVFQKMLRIIKTNSVLIFPEGSHNYDSNKVINNLYDGPVNLALQTNRKIVPVTLIKDDKNNVYYIDVGNPINVKDIDIDMNKEFSSENEMEEYYVNSLSLVIRDKMATAVDYIVTRHFKPLERGKYGNIEEELRQEKIDDAFKKLKWNRDIFEAEYLTKKTKAEREYEDIVNSISNLYLNNEVLQTLNNKDWVLRKSYLDNKDVVKRMREHLLLVQDGEVVEGEKRR